MSVCPVALPDDVQQCKCSAVPDHTVTQHKGSFCSAPVQREAHGCASGTNDDWVYLHDIQRQSREGMRQEQGQRACPKAYNKSTTAPLWLLAAGIAPGSRQQALQARLQANKSCNCNPVEQVRVKAGWQLQCCTIRKVGKLDLGLLA